MTSQLDNGPGRIRRFPGARALSTAAVVALAAAACADHPTETNAPESPSFDVTSAPGLQRLAGLDGEFARIASDAPGFGGMFYDADGRLNVYVAPAGRSMQAQSRIMTRVNASLRGQDPELLGRGVRVLEGTRDFAELASLKSRMHPVLAEPGVVFTDIDETRNRLRVGVLEGTSTEQIENILEGLGVPGDAVIVEYTEPIEPLATLRDQVDPVAGGLQIWRLASPTTASICTLGFNVRFAQPASSQAYFFTNSHCTAVRGEVTGTEFRQGPLSLATRTIAVEVADPPFFECQYVGYRCRFSDAALAQYLPGVPYQFGKIYQTEEVSTSTPGTLEINAEDSRFTIIRERNFPLVGEVLDKVGRTSGWTRGPVIATCIDTGVSGSFPPIAMLCQDRVEAYSAGGDSGSPVFQQFAQNNPVTLFGILWGGSANTYVFSALENIRAEFGPFRVR